LVPNTFKVKLAVPQFGAFAVGTVAGGTIADSEEIVGAGGWVIVNATGWEVDWPGAVFGVKI
jgi:hypothetical protein